MTFAAIIFDFDGVVADSEVRANLSLAESLTAAGMPATYDECLRDYYGHNWQETQRRIEARYGRPLPADFRETHRTRARGAIWKGSTRCRALRISWARSAPRRARSLRRAAPNISAGRSDCSGSAIISESMSTAPTAGTAASRTQKYISTPRRGG